jgi:ankyrin repeat protein
METGKAAYNQSSPLTSASQNPTGAGATSSSEAVATTVTNVSQATNSSTYSTHVSTTLIDESELPPLVDDEDPVSAAQLASSPVPYRALPLANLLFDLPGELLINIGSRLDFNSTQAFAGSCRQSRALYKAHIFPQQCLELINKHELDEVEKAKLERYYKLILVWLFKEEIEEDEAKKLMHLAEKFFKHLPLSEVSTILMTVLSGPEDQVVTVFEKLANINLPFTISLIAALDDDKFAIYYPALPENLSPNLPRIHSFITDMHTATLAGELTSSSALHYALEKRYFDIVLVLLRACPESVNTLDEQGFSLLMAACARLPSDNEIREEENAGAGIEKLESLAHLLEKVEKIDTLEELVDLLIRSSEINVNLQDKSGWTILIQAIIDKKFSVIYKLFQRQDININIQDPEGYNALMYAIHQLQLSIVNKLLKKDADVNLINAAHHTALLESILTEGNPELACLIVEALLNSGADIELQDEEGRTVLTHAILNGRVHIAQLLIKRGANINHQDAQGMSPLMHAIVDPKRFNLATLLLRQGANIYLQDNLGRNASDYLRNNYSLTGWIMRYGEFFKLPPEIIAEQRTAPLFQAIIEGEAEIVKFLLGQGANFNYQDAQGATPLMYAVFQGQTEIVRLLLNNIEIGINLQD